MGGGGRKPKLTLESQIILTLTYLRHLPTFQLLSIQFGVSETVAEKEGLNIDLGIKGESGILVRKLLKRASFLSKDNLNNRIFDFINYFNQTMAKPFKWTYTGKVLAI